MPTYLYLPEMVVEKEMTETTLNHSLRASFENSEHVRTPAFDAYIMSHALRFARHVAPVVDMDEGECSEIFKDRAALNRTYLDTSLPYRTHGLFKNNCYVTLINPVYSAPQIRQTLAHETYHVVSKNQCNSFKVNDTLFRAMQTGLSFAHSSCPEPVQSDIMSLWWVNEGLADFSNFIMRPDTYRPHYDIMASLVAAFTLLDKQFYPELVQSAFFTGDVVPVLNRIGDLTYERWVFEASAKLREALSLRGSRQDVSTAKFHAIQYLSRRTIRTILDEHRRINNSDL
ncbi:MAG TPA: hypothetical protein PKD20_04230 [Candidatus Saccharibacteria bacterium]|jgi:hypothetical protein|nr:hypothetical protein [Candidatus Saccharibacteria bacterium]HMT56056.1 hypothetical protein [Candidatus Saccharibacteria bacterium]